MSHAVSRRGCNLAARRPDAARRNKMSDLGTRLAALEARVRLLEDQAAIYQLLAAYGPAVDSLAGEAAAALFADDAVYEAGEFHFAGHDAIAGLVDIEPHRTWVGRGCTHVVGLPRVEIDGDTAVAVNHSRVYVKDRDHWRVERLSANRWELARAAAGWKVARRINRVLDGSEAARALLR